MNTPQPSGEISLPEPTPIVGEVGRNSVHWGLGYTAEQVRAAILADRERSAGAVPVATQWYELNAPMLCLGEAYTTADGHTVTMVEIANVGKDYESMADQHGHHRYSRSHERIIGRLTGSDKNDPGNIMFPLPAASPAPAQETGATEPKFWHGVSRFANDFTTSKERAEAWHRDGWQVTPLYTAPQPSTEAPGGAAEGWQPIATAPKDGTTIYLHQAGKVFEGSWLDDPFAEHRDADGHYVGQQDPESYWMEHTSGDELEPTEWMNKRLPAAPRLEVPADSTQGEQSHG